jgi:hypothetical protein
MGTELSIRASYQSLIAANREAIKLRETLDDIDDADYGVHVTGGADVERYNQAFRRHSEQLAQENMGWRSKYKLSDKPVNSDEISQWERENSGQGSSAASYMKKAALTVAGLAGVGGVVALIAEAVAKYREIDPAQADAATLGLGTAGYGSHGYMMGERFALSRQLAGGTGWQDVKGTGDEAMKLARGRSMDVSEVGNFMTGMYKTTGATKQTVEGMTAWVFANTKNGLRQTDILSGILGLQQKQMQQQGGAVSEAQTAFLSAMFTKGFDKNVMLQTTGAYDKLNSGMAAGGNSSGEQLLLWKLAGGDKFDGSFGSMEQIKAAQMQGLGNDKYRKGVKDYLSGMDPAKARMALNAMFGLAPGEKNESGLMLDMLNSSGDMSADEIIKQMKSKGWKDRNIAKVFKNYSPSASRDELASQEGDAYRAGKAMGPPLQKLKSFAFDKGADIVEGAANIIRNLDKATDASRGLKVWWDGAERSDRASASMEKWENSQDPKAVGKRKTRQEIHEVVDQVQKQMGYESPALKGLETLVLKLLNIPQLTPARPPAPARGSTR